VNGSHRIVGLAVHDVRAAHRPAASRPAPDVPA
jgi:hypothetical protein